jgi:hypothetical protein
LAGAALCCGAGELSVGSSGASGSAPEAAFPWNWSGQLVGASGF